MNRTHAFVALAAVLTLFTTLQPISRWWERARQEKVVAVPRASSAGSLRLEAALSHGQPLEGGATYLRYDVRATDAKANNERQAVQLALVIDRSGSMAGDKLARARAAALRFVDLLTAEDELAVVTFGSDTSYLPVTFANEAGKQAMRSFINAMSESGGTNISGGLELAQMLLQAAPQRGVRRIVLMSDGQPTEGRTSEHDLVELTAGIHEQRTAVTALGIGYDFNAQLMQRLAERGGGFYAYLNDPERLTQVLELELGQARGALARNVALRIELAGGAELVQVAGREMKQVGSTVTVPLPDFAPGQTAQAFVELKLPPGTIALKATARLEYFDSTGDRTTSEPAELAANTTPDAELAEASKDEKIASACILAMGSTKMVAAAAAFERGDRASAFALLDNARKIFAMSADSLAGDMADITETTKRWENTTDAQAVSDQAKNLTRKKMLNFGQNNAY